MSWLLASVGDIRSVCTYLSTCVSSLAVCDDIFAILTRNCCSPLPLNKVVVERKRQRDANRLVRAERVSLCIAHLFKMC